MEVLLENISISLEFCEKSKTTLIPTKDSVKSNLKSKCVKLKQAIASRDMSYVIQMIKDKNGPLRIDGNTKSFVESKELEALSKLLEELNTKCKA